MYSMVVAVLLLTLILLNTSNVLADQLPPPAKAVSRRYFTFTSGDSSNTCSSIKYLCDGGTTGYISSRSVSGSGVIIGFTANHGQEISLYWTYSSVTTSSGCSNTIILKGKVTSVTGPAPVTMDSAVTVTLNDGNWPSGTMTVTDGTFTGTLSGQSNVYCAV